MSKWTAIIKTVHLLKFILLNFQSKCNTVEWWISQGVLYP